MTFLNEEDLKSRKENKRFIKNICNVKVLKRKLPIVEWLPKYNVGAFIQDLIAGLTVGLTAIPQGIAYAVITGLPPEYGLYSSLTAGAVYTIFGSCKDISVGPTAILSAITAKYVSSYSADFAVLATFLSGVLILTMSVLRLGFLVEFISLPVISGFTTAAALQISASQLKTLFGLTGSSGNYFAESVYNFVLNIKTINPWDLLLGLSTIAALVFLKRLGEGCGPKDVIAKKIRWLICLSRNAVVVFAGMVIAYILKEHFENQSLNLIGEIKGGLPEFGLPPFITVLNNKTYSFIDMVEVLGPKSLVIPLIAVLEIIVLSKVFSMGNQVDATQEMFALGLCNIIGAFGKGMPITGAFTRSTLNHVSGVKTTAGGIITCILIVLALTLLTSTFPYIPKASLAGLIIAAVFSMIDIPTVNILWRSSKRELFVLFITMVGSLFQGLEYGIVAGILAEAFVVFYKEARPELDVRIIRDIKNVLVIKLTKYLLYCNAENIRRKCLKLSATYYDSVLIIDGANLSYLDFTVASNLMSLIKDLTKNSRQIFFVNFNVYIKNMCIDIYPESSYHFVNTESYLDVLGSIVKLP